MSNDAMLTEVHKQLGSQYTAHDFITALGWRISTHLNQAVRAQDRNDNEEAGRLLNLIVIDMGYIRGFDRKVSAHKTVQQLNEYIEEWAQTVEQKAVEIKETIRE